ncbi:hypothetical protein GCM10009623_36500 [Nocardioides aestuarii]
MWVGVAVAAVVITLVWRGFAGHTLDQVVVGVTGHDCRDTAKVRERADTSLLVRTSEEMRCTFTVTVANHGGRPVHVGEVRAAAMGPETGSVLLAESIDGSAPHGELATVDALHALDRELAGDSTTTFDIVVVFHPEGCNDSGTLTLFGFPQVELSALAVHRTVDASEDLAFRNTIRTPGCRHPNRG